MTKTHAVGIEKAIEAAGLALEAGESPYGAAIFKNGELLTAQHNRAYSTGDPTLHAEMLAIRTAVDRLGMDLRDCVLYTTCEPCPMCLGAALWAGVEKIVAGTHDEQFGAFSSGFNGFPQPIVEYLQDERCVRLKDTAAGLRAQASPFTPADPRKREQRMAQQTFSGRASEVYRLFGRQSVSIEQSANSLITLSGILIAITAAGLAAVNMLNPSSRIAIGIGTALALVSSTLVIVRVLRFRWAGSLAADPKRRHAGESMIDMLQSIRDRKTKDLDIAITILCLSLAAYASGVVLGLIGSF